MLKYPILHYIKEIKDKLGFSRAIDPTIGATDVIDAVNKQSSHIDGMQDGLAIVSNGDSHVSITAGQFVYVKNHNTLAEGLYIATTNIGTNEALTTSNLTVDEKGGLNKLIEAESNSIQEYELTYTKTGKIVHIDIDYRNESGFTIDAYGSIILGVLPVGYRPIHNVIAPVFARKLNNDIVNHVILRAHYDGNLYIANMNTSVTLLQALGNMTYIIQ